MRILILEDNQDRQNKFNELFRNQELFIFDNAVDAHHACLLRDFQIMFLDHDLGQEGWVKSEEENTGHQFVKWLIEKKLQKSALIYIHSMNPIGANKMLNLLLDNGYDGIWIPFNLILGGNNG